MHQRLHDARDESIVDEEVLLDFECRVSSLEIAGAIAFDAMSQGQVLGASRCPYRVRLDEGERVDRPLEGRGRKEAARDGKPTQFVDRDSHGQMVG